jgi:hypothetical protein
VSAGLRAGRGLPARVPCPPSAHGSRGSPSSRTC